MAYLNQTHRASPASMAAVIGIHAGAAVALIWGLSVTGVIETDTPMTTWDVKDDIPPPPPEPQPDTREAKPTQPVERPITAPDPVINLDVDIPTGPIIHIDAGPLPPITGSGTERIVARPSPTPSFDPVRAAPRNNPGLWITTSDYRSSWIRREMVGTASFRLEIAANGRIENCTITRSTGHTPLDQATCRLVKERAKFEPARGTNGEAVAGSFSSAVKWQLPN
ncbi:energy transducer TonB [Qipengyuania sp. DGS5-3]|uniref:energy transducer TonB n=1 Tax=Qipengyuania sp. DGS5-3 TaxID=3349632 RepID=UPI0036D37CEB